MSNCRTCGGPAGNKSAESYCSHPCSWAAGGTGCGWLLLVLGAGLGALVELVRAVGA